MLRICAFEKKIWISRDEKEEFFVFLYQAIESLSQHIQPECAKCT